VRRSIATRWFLRLAQDAGVSASTLKFRLQLRLLYCGVVAVCVYAGSKSLLVAIASIPILYAGVLASVLIRTYIEEPFFRAVAWLGSCNLVGVILVAWAHAAWMRVPIDWQTVLFFWPANMLLVGFFVPIARLRHRHGGTLVPGKEANL
jgi:hypothetical protein